MPSVPSRARLLCPRFTPPPFLLRVTPDLPLFAGMSTSGTTSSTTVAAAAGALFYAFAVARSKIGAQKRAGPPEVARPDRGIWKHKVMKSAVDPQMLQDTFENIKAEFEPQLVTYKGQEWKISTYMELDNTGHISGKHKIEPDVQMLEICRNLLDECTTQFEEWYNEDRKLKYCKAERLHSFVTRYLPVEGQNQLKKHIDGRHLDGSCIIRLPTDDPCIGGEVKVWDRMVSSGVKSPTQEFFYPMKTGDLCLLDRAVWHQAMPVTSGIKWAIIIFFKVHRKKPAGESAVV